jgi:hypothetical protein
MQFFLHCASINGGERWLTRKNAHTQLVTAPWQKVKRIAAHIATMPGTRLK